MNMCMIRDRETNRVVVLDKVKRQGWEGLTFPGGHVEPYESMTDAVQREVFEETNLRIGDVVLKGMITWYDRSLDLRQTGLLFYTEEFEGELVDGTREGKVFWADYDAFLKEDGKSDSMDDMLKIYEGRAFEVISFYDNHRHLSTEFR